METTRLAGRGRVLTEEEEKRVSQKEDRKGKRVFFLPYLLSSYKMDQGDGESTTKAATPFWPLITLEVSPQYQRAPESAPAVPTSHYRAFSLPCLVETVGSPTGGSCPRSSSRGTRLQVQNRLQRPPALALW